MCCLWPLCFGVFCVFCGIPSWDAFFCFQLQVSFGRALLHSALHGLTLPLLAQILCLTGCSLAIGRALDPPERQGVAVVTAGGLIAIFLFLVYLQFVRTHLSVSFGIWDSMESILGNVGTSGVEVKVHVWPHNFLTGILPHFHPNFLSTC